MSKSSKLRAQARYPAADCRGMRKRPTQLSAPAPLASGLESAREMLHEVIRRDGLLTAPQHRLVSPSGAPIAWLIDMRRVLMRAECLDAAAELFWQAFADFGPFQVGGMEVAAIPLVAAILMKGAARGRRINGFVVRKERKTYGAGALVEGVVGEEPIVIVDDITNSGGSFEKVRVILDSLDRRIDACFSVIDYKSPQGLAWRESHQVPVSSIFELSEFKTPSGRKRQPALDPIFEEVWKFSPPDPNFSQRVPKSFPVSDGERVYFGSDAGTFWALDVRTGRAAWRFDVVTRGHKNIWSAPALHENHIYFGAYDGNVYCLEARSGREIWRFIGADWVGSSPALAPELGLLFIGLEYSKEGRKGSVVALDIETGEKVWEHFTNRFTHASPAYWPEKKVVACGSNDDEMFLFEAETGRVFWRFQTRGDGAKGSIRHAPAFDTRRGHVITGCADGYIYIVDVDTGREVWHARTDNTIYTVPLVVDDLAFVGSTDKCMYVLDLQSKLVRGRIYTGSKIFSPPRLIRGKVYFGTCDGKIYELSLEPLGVSGMHQTAEAITNPVAYDDATDLYLASNYLNELIALRHI